MPATDIRQVAANLLWPPKCSILFFLCVLCVFAVKVCHFKAAKMRSRMASIEPTPAILTYFGAPGLPLAAHFE